METSLYTQPYYIIGQFTDVAVRITVDGDVIFDVDLPVQLEDPVRLYLKYVDVDSDKVDEVQTSAMYTNLKYIRHIEFNSDVIFERFRVTIAVESVDGIRGPLRPAGQYGESNSSTLAGIRSANYHNYIILCMLIVLLYTAYT